MMDKQKDDTSLVLTGVFNIMRIVGARKILTNGAFILSLVISLVFMVAVCLTGKDSFALIDETQTLVIGFLPAILGFTIAGYTLVIGFIQNGMLKRIGAKKDGQAYSLYQIISANFAMNILVQVFSLMLAYLFHYILFFQKNTVQPFSCSIGFIDHINSVSLLILIFAFTLSLLMLAQIVINIFDFSQLHHYFISKDTSDKTEV